MKITKTIALAILVTLSGCVAVDEFFAPVEPPERVVGPVYYSSTGEKFPGPVYYHYPERILDHCPYDTACARVSLDENDKPIPGKPCVIFLPWVQKERYLEHEEDHCLNGNPRHFISQEYHRALLSPWR